MHWRFRALAGGWLLAALVGCSGVTRPPVAVPVAPPAAADGAGESARRELLRVSYQGPRGGGSARLALLVLSATRFQARASDTFGRALWSLESTGSEAIFIDHRRRLFCLSEGDLRVPEPALEALPLARLPAVLAGELPAAPAAGSAQEDEEGEGDFFDPSGRRWTAVREDGVLTAWTLWSEAGPVLWWRRLEAGGMLSSRDGAQFRWRRSVVEPLTVAPPAVAAPEGYQATDCETLTGGEAS